MASFTSSIQSNLTYICKEEEEEGEEGEERRLEKRKNTTKTAAWFIPLWSEWLDPLQLKSVVSLWKLLIFSCIQHKEGINKQDD